eukprot:gnl/MRDRNA2_/MRDRNA2_110714_c0_seq1.p1 gnl/MRDRNA2_/MRDRNA2_110714_c0~~gnl/MRDRNA2_/MRDRNA2_110714_c0_seq1.p1  ORF type:complete len:301 (+),score=57.81 gnl/MRDRNA2_/MRDRNA2_110714_c0_seq1:127-1029(+)
MDAYNFWSICDAPLGLISFAIGWYFINKLLLCGRGMSWQEASVRLRNKVQMFVDKFSEESGEEVDDLVGRPVPHPLAQNVVGWMSLIPGELKSEVAKCFPLKDLHSLSITDRTTYHSMWGNKQVWFALHLARGIAFSTDVHDSLDQIRDTFRKSLFQVELSMVKSLKCLEPKALMIAATRTLSGMMLHDGPQLRNLVYDLIMKALHEFEPSAEGAQVAADSLLCTVRARRDVLSKAEIEAIEDAFDDAQRLDSLMENAASNHLQRLLRSLGVNEPESSCSAPCQRWDIACELLADSYRSS